MDDLAQKIGALKKKLNAIIVAHYYQRDEVVNIADLCGDSLELSRKASQSDSDVVVFCGVSFMGQSVKILSPDKRVIMPRLACCSMARMIDSSYFDTSIDKLESLGIARDNIFPITYINSNADVKAKIGKMGGVVCTSANASKIFNYALSKNKKIFFVPDKCLGLNLAIANNKISSVLGISSDEEIINSDVICYDGFCSVHQLFTVDDIEFYRHKYEDIIVAVHPECDPSVVAAADFYRSTSQIISFVSNLDEDAKVVVGTEFNLVNRLTKKNGNRDNIFVLSSSKPECPTMNETSLQDLYDVMGAFDNGLPYNEIELSEDSIFFAKRALDKMMELS